MRNRWWSVTGLLLVSVIAAGCSAPADEGSSKDGPGGWTYVDDRGVRVSTEDTPRRIIAQVSAAGALKDFGVQVTGTFGPLVRDDGSIEPEAGSIDPSKVTNVTGPGYGQLDMERVATLRPDLLVSGMYAEFSGLWHLVQDQEEIVKRIVPTAGIEQSGRSLPKTIQAYRKLAGRLGADVNSERVRRDEQRFHAAAERLRGIGAELRSQGRTILAIGGTPQEFFVVVPGRNPDLDYYLKELGLPIVTPKHPDTEGGGYFERLSWENSSAYSGDILLWDTRDASMRPEQMMRNPVFAARESAASNRFVQWDAVAPFSYTSYADIMNTLADQLQATMRKFD